MGFGNIDIFLRFLSAPSLPALRLITIFEVMLGKCDGVWLLYLSLFNLLHALWPDIKFLNRPEVVFKCASLLRLGKKGELLPL